ncbi:MAG TPA: TIGR04255 family protein [Candidatus Acidoferrum sp.]|nr:TIGR04255 family protein [Candidatus Acidoferrum sp.]
MPRETQEPISLRFNNPPVTETSLGFYFQRIEGWHLLHQGLLWEKFRTKYPQLEILPTILDPGSTRLQLDLNAPVLRTGFADSTKTKLVQIQDGLLLHNWRKTPEAPKYNRYEMVRDLLLEDWSIFCGYLRSASLKEPVVSRCEMSYFNHLVRGEEWKDFSDLPEIFPTWRGVSQPKSSGTLQMAAFNVAYRVDRGVVNVAVHPGIRSNDGKEVIQLTLSSYIAPSNSDNETLFETIDECHENAARAFVDFTTDKVRERWK